MPGNLLQVDGLSEVTRLDGVYIKEEAPPGAVVPVLGGVVCVIGEFERGPVDQVVSIGRNELTSVFGGLGPDSSGNFYKGALAMLGKVEMGPLRVIRLSNSTQATASLTITDGAGTPVNVITCAARSPGAWGNRLTASTKAATDGNSAHFDLEIKQGGIVVRTFRNLDLSAIVNGAEFPQTSGDQIVKVTRIALGDGSPAIVTDQALTSGADGTFADADYVGSSSDARGIQLLLTAQAEDIRIAFVAERSTSAVNAGLLAASAATGKNVVLSGITSVAKATTKTDVALYRSDRVFFVGTSVRIFAAEANGGAGGLVDVLGNSFLASIISSEDPGVNPAGPGERGNHIRLLAAVREIIDRSLVRQDYEDFRRLGVCAIEANPLGGFTFKSGVTTSQLSGLKNIARRTIADYVQLSGGTFLLQFQNLPINADLKGRIKTALSAFLDDQIRIGLLPGVADLAPGLFPYAITFSSSPTQEAAGILIVDLRLRIFSSADFIVFRTQIGEGVEIRLQELQQAA